MLRVHNLQTHFRTDGRGLARAGGMGCRFTLFPNQTLAMVGESGCGKSVTSLSILRLVPTPPGKYPGGAIMYRDGGGRVRDLLTLPEKQMRKVRRGADCDDLSGTDDEFESGVHDRRSDCRGDFAASREAARGTGGKAKAVEIAVQAA